MNKKYKNKYRIASARLRNWDYGSNGMFGTKFSTKGSQSFCNYYNDISKKVKKRKIDILLVVNMFLTGFDSLPLTRHLSQ